MDIQDLLGKHAAMELPPFPVDDLFSEWMEELIEVDAYYFGLASSSASGYLQPVNTSYFDDLKTQLLQIVPSEEDKEIYALSVTYIKSLEDVVDYLK